MEKIVSQTSHSTSEPSISSTPTSQPSSTSEDLWANVSAANFSNSVIFSDRGSEWREVRVFVSSTFTDFFAEREVLVKHVFPRLRQILRLYYSTVMFCHVMSCQKTLVNIWMILSFFDIM